jgi:hypothetical protein
MEYIDTLQEVDLLMLIKKENVEVLVVQENMCGTLVIRHPLLD